MSYVFQTFRTTPIVAYGSPMFRKARHLKNSRLLLGVLQEAIEAYSSAVQRDPTLHVCQANLAQLHAYLEDVCVYVQL